MEAITVAALLGTARRGRRSEGVFNAVTTMLDTFDDVTVTRVDVTDMDRTATLPPWGKGGTDEQPTAWKQTMEQADALLIVVPEYNHGYPGELKMALDALYDEYAGKPVLLCGVSKGRMGGGRVVENLQPVLSELHMVFVPEPILVARAGEVVAEGVLVDEKLRERGQKSLEMLVRYARALKGAHLS